MIKFIKYLLIGLFTFSALVSCDSGSNKEQVIDLTKKSKGTKKNGYDTAYHASGEISSILGYKNGRKHGLAQSFYPDGKPMRKINYVNGVKDGLAQTFYENGKLQLETNYVNGRKHGLRKRYYSFGTPASEQEWKNDYAGKLVEYTKRGKVRTKYPELKLNVIDRVSSTGEYTIEVAFDRNAKRAKYYVGKLDEGIFMHDKMEELPTTNGKGIVYYELAPGSFAMEKLNIVGVQKTAKGDYYIAQKTFNVAIEK